MAATAAITERVLIGPLVAASSFHNPAMLAKKAATVDEISGGRLILGLGAGWNRVEYQAFGFPFDHRASRFEEAFTIIRHLLRDGEVDFAGEYYSVPNCELMPRPRPGGPPLMIGSEGPRVLRATLPHVDMWNAWRTWFGNSPDGLASMMTILDEICIEVGRHPTEISRTAALLVQVPGGTGRVYGAAEHAGSMPLTGSHAEIADALRRFAAVGVDHVQLVVDPITVDSISWLAGALDDLDRPP